MKTDKKTRISDGEAEDEPLHIPPGHGIIIVAKVPKDKLLEEKDST